MNQNAYLEGQPGGRVPLGIVLGARLRRMSDRVSQMPRQTLVGTILLVALLAFEIFNFDTTRYALTNLLGNVEFMGLGWAAILAVAFCAIDFAGLVRVFTPERGADEPKEVWYLMGAWLLGATMNALMTWWAVSLTLLNHDFGNEVLNRAQLLRIVPIFVATMVWLIRILFIGSLTVAGEQLFHGNHRGPARKRKSKAQSRSRGRKLPARAGRSATPARAPRSKAPPRTTAVPKPATAKSPASGSAQTNGAGGGSGRPRREPAGRRSRQRPPMPRPSARGRRPAPGGGQAFSGRNQQ